MRNASIKAIPNCTAPKQRERYSWRLIQKVTHENVVVTTPRTKKIAQATRVKQEILEEDIRRDFVALSFGFSEGCGRCVGHRPLVGEVLSSLPQRT